MKIEINNLSGEKIDLKRLKLIATVFFQKYKIDGDISIAIISDEEMRRVNYQYRGIDQTTDVLSFEGLREVLLSPTQIKKQASDLGKEFKDELEFILVHGLLHLLGFQDKHEDGRLQMISLGEKFLSAFNAGSYSKNIKKGFTLIEMLVSLSIVIILSSLLVANYKTGDKYSSLLNFQSSLVSDLNLIKWKAKNGELYDGELPYYWGIYLEKESSSYQVFADFNNNFFPDEDEIDSYFGAKKYLSTGNIVSQTSLSDRVVIAFSTEDGLPIFYDLNTDLSSYSDLVIELKSQKYDLAKLVVVNSVGLSDFYDCSCVDETKYCCSACPLNAACRVY